MKYRAKLLRKSLEERGFSLNEKAVYDALVKSREICDVIREITLREVVVETEVMMFLKELGFQHDKLADKDLITYLSNVYMKPYLTLTKPVEGIEELFKTIKDMKIKTAIVSNTMKGNVTRELVRNYGLEKYINAYVLSDEVCYRKPHPMIFKIALNKLQVSPSQALMVGDEECDMEGANNLGIRALLFSGFRKGKNKGKYREVFSVTQLISLIEELSNEN